jgi:small-conductance mechanosensitive channel
MMSAVSFHRRCRVGMAKHVWLMVRTMRKLSGLILLITVATMAAPLVTMAQRTGEEATIVATEMGLSTAPVTLDGKTLFRVRGVSAYPAEQRARAIAERIKALAADTTIPTTALRTVETEDRTDIMGGEQFIMGVFDVDARLEGVKRQLLAQTLMKKISEVVEDYREQRRPDRLLNNTLYALAATALLVGLLLAIRWAFRRLNASLEQRYQVRIQKLEAQSLKFVRAEQLRIALHRALQTMDTLVVLVLLYVYFHFVLSLYPWTRQFAEHLLTLLLNPLVTMGAALLAAVPNLVFIAVLVVVTRYLLKLTRLFSEAVAQGTVTLSGFDREWASPTYRIIRLLIIAFAVVVAYPYIPGSESAAFKGVSLFLGVIFSLGSSSIIANLIAGYTMTYRRAFRVGDRIRVSDFIGDVADVRLMVTHLRSLKNEEIIVPNSLILNSHVINYSSLARQNGLILHTTVGIGYETPWRQVEAMLLMAAERTPGLLCQPTPFVLQQALGDFCVTYELNAYCDEPAAMYRLYTELHRNILDVFNEYNVQIMTPAYERDPEQPKVVPKEQWFAEPAQLSRRTMNKV